MRGYAKTLTLLTTRLAGLLDDSSHERWTLTEKEEAINVAIISAFPRWHEVQTTEDNTYSKTVYRYTLPYGAEDLIAVYLEPTTAGEAWKLIRTWHTDGDYLYLHEAQDNLDGKKMRMVCVAAPWELRKYAAKTDGVTTLNTSNFSSATGTFVTWGVKPGDRLFLKSGTGLSADVGEWWIKSVTSETALVVYGKFTETTSVVVYAVNEDTRVPEMFILHKAAAEVYQLAGHKGAGQDIAEDMQWAEFHSQMAEYYLDKQERQFPTRRG